MVARHISTRDFSYWADFEPAEMWIASIGVILDPFSLYDWTTIGRKYFSDLSIAGSAIDEKTAHDSISSQYTPLDKYFMISFPQSVIGWYLLTTVLAGVTWSPPDIRVSTHQTSGVSTCWRTLTTLELNWNLPVVDFPASLICFIGEYVHVPEGHYSINSLKPSDAFMRQKELTIIGSDNDL